MSSKETPNQRLAILRKRLGLSYNDFAAPLEVSHMTVRRWESGEVSVNRAVALLVSDSHRASAKWLLEGKGDMMLPEADKAGVSGDSMSSVVSRTKEIASRLISRVLEMQTGDVVKNVPLLAYTPHLGIGGTLSDFVATEGAVINSFDRKWLETYLRVDMDNLCGLEVIGDGMEPSIKHGDFVFVEGFKEIPAFRAGVWLIQRDGRLLLRRVRMSEDGRYLLSSDNPAYKAEELDDPGCLLGIVVGGPPKTY